MLDWDTDAVILPRKDKMKALRELIDAKKELASIKRRKSSPLKDKLVRDWTSKVRLLTEQSRGVE